jgi:hypothetical protein
MMDVRERRMLERCHAIARSHGGRCMSRSYENMKVKLSWVCELGHRWSANPEPILKLGRWCKACGHERRARRDRERTLQKASAVASRRGGACLSLRFDRSTDRLEFRCARGHHWFTPPYLVLRGTWCRRCALARVNRRVAEKKFEAVRALARRRGGRCLSTTYENAHASLRWRCREGHEWETSAHAIGRTWCPRCAGVAHLTLEELQQRARSRGGECLAERYENTWTPVPWRCAAGHTWWATPSNVMHQGTWCARCYSAPRDELARLRRIAKRHGGRCLSEEYEGSLVPLLWRCRKGHEWWTKPRYVVGGSWCAICRRSTGPRPEVTLEDMKAAAAERGGACLSRQYFNSDTPLRWQCARGHEWEAVPGSVRGRGSWCPTCASSVPGTIDGLRAWAADLGGRCLSTEYDDPRTPLRWECRRGHRFQTLAKAVKSGVWCPQCARRPTSPRPPPPMGTGKRKPGRASET